MSKAISANSRVSLVVGQLILNRWTSHKGSATVCRVSGVGDQSRLQI